MQKSNSSLLSQTFKGIFLFIIFSIGGGVFGFIGGFFVADYNDSVEKKAMEWQLLDSPVKFTQLVDANFSTVWAQAEDEKLYFWNFDCSLQQKCNQWVETKNIDNQETPMEKNSTCLFSNEPGLKLSKEPPGKIVECGRFNFLNFYVLLEDGTIWHWETLIPGDGLPNEVVIFAFIGFLLGIYLGAIFCIIIISRSKESNK